MSLTHTANAAGRRRSALAPAAAGDGSEQCLWWRLLFAALLPGRSGFLLLPALLGLAGGGRSAWGGGRSARGRGRLGRRPQRPGPRRVQRPEPRERLQRREPRPRR